MANSLNKIYQGERGSEVDSLLITMWLIINCDICSPGVKVCERIRKDEHFIHITKQ